MKRNGRWKGDEGATARARELSHACIVELPLFLCKTRCASNTTLSVHVNAQLGYDKTHAGLRIDVEHRFYEGVRGS